LYNESGDKMNIKEINPLVYAYLGDAIYEVYIREYLINKNMAKVKDLQQEAKKYVTAVNQAKYLELIKDMLTEEELNIIKRARNTKVNSHPKNTDIITYKHSTALEALIGYLYLNNEIQRMEEIINSILLIEIR